MGGAIELSFRFVESAPGPIYPTSADATQPATAAAATTADTASGKSLGGSILSAVNSGADAVGQAITTVSRLGYAGRDGHADRHGATPAP